MPKISFQKNPQIPSFLINDYQITESLWNSYTWQMQNSIKNILEFRKYFKLSDSEEQAFKNSEAVFNIRTTPYYASLCKDVESDPIRKILMPSLQELKSEYQEMLDPLGEKVNLKTPRLIHRYSDRVLFLVTDFCSVYCRYCTRKHFTGNELSFLKAKEFEESLSYIKSHPGIREVILSGGDPLTLSNNIIDNILNEIRKIEHVEIIRIGSRMPVVCPQRIDEDLLKTMRRYKPVYLMTHFNHPRELTEIAAEKLEMIVDHGIPTFNQMVLLNGINNHEAIVQALSRRLLYLRVKPYYMFQCDPSLGTDHLRTSLEDSLTIQRNLWGHLSGLAMPQLSLDIPNGGGKAYFVPSFLLERTHRSIKFQGWDGVEGEYVNPSRETIVKPLDLEDYMKEWETLKALKTC